MVAGASAWAEDHWASLQIGDLEFAATAPNGRCTVCLMPYCLKASNCACIEGHNTNYKFQGEELLCCLSFYRIVAAQQGLLICPLLLSLTPKMAIPQAQQPYYV